MTHKRVKRIVTHPHRVTRWVAGLGVPFQNDQPDGYVEVFNHEHKLGYCPVYDEGPITDNYPLMTYNYEDQYYTISAYPTYTDLFMEYASNTSSLNYVYRELISPSLTYIPRVRRVGWWRVHVEMTALQNDTTDCTLGFMVHHRDADKNIIKTYADTADIVTVGTNGNYDRLVVDFITHMKLREYVDVQIYRIGGSSNTRAYAFHEWNPGIYMEFLCQA